MLVGREERDRSAVNLVFDIVRLTQLGNEGLANVVTNRQVLGDVLAQLIDSVFAFVAIVCFVTLKFQPRLFAFVIASVVSNRLLSRRPGSFGLRLGAEVELRVIRGQVFLTP